MLIDQVQELVRTHYVFPDVATRIADSLHDLTTDDLDDLDEAALADRITTALQAINGDRHLRVRHYPEGVPPDQDEDEVTAHFDAMAREQGPGITEVRRQTGNAGVLKVGPVILPPAHTGPAAAAAFTLLDGVSRLVIDLRECLGGVPQSVALLVSHLLGDEPVHLLDFVHRDGTAEPSYTTPTVAPMATSAAYLRREASPVRGALPSEGAAVDLPATAPEDYEERSALLERMVAARPDKANPFTDRRARLHRARLILQSLGRDFSQSEPWIDLSQYPNNWPELANKHSAAA